MELPGASVRLGVASGHGYSDDGGELRSVVCARGKQRREWGPGGERGGAGARASPWRREGVGETATAKQEVAGALRARATPRLCLLAEEEEDKGGKEVGWAALGRCWRQVSGWRSWAR